MFFVEAVHHTLVPEMMPIYLGFLRFVESDTNSSQCRQTLWIGDSGASCGFVVRFAKHVRD